MSKAPAKEIWVVVDKDGDPVELALSKERAVEAAQDCSAFDRSGASPYTPHRYVLAATETSDNQQTGGET